jgi:cytosine/adenosine deaminase-related metal-dependent hydrolase
MRIGLSPHAPYTVEGPALSAILDAADTDKLPLCMHVAELTEEAEFLRTCGGEIRRAWEAINLAQLLLDEKIPRFEGGPVRWARQWGLLPPGGVGAPVALAHVNYADDEEIDIIRAAGASVVYCPRTRAFFGHDAVTPHRFRDMLDAGVNVCLGTDSLASNPDLFLLREARFLLRKDPTLSPTLLLEMVTSGGSRALGTSHDAGTLAEGCSADIAAFPLSGAHGSAEAMLRDVIGRAPGASAVWIGGAKVL